MKPIVTLLLVICLGLFIACSPCTYSIVVTNREVTPKANGSNFLGAQEFNQRSLIIPEMIEPRRGDVDERIANAIKGQKIHAINDVFKVNTGTLTVPVHTFCANRSIAAVIIERSDLKSNGKKIALDMKVVCYSEEFKSTPFIATPTHLITLTECDKGIHTLTIDFNDLLDENNIKKLRLAVVACEK